MIWLSLSRNGAVGNRSMNLSLNNKNATIMAFSMSAVSLVFTKPDIL